MNPDPKNRREPNYFVKDDAITWDQAKTLEEHIRGLLLAGKRRHDPEFQHLFSCFGGEAHVVKIAKRLLYTDPNLQEQLHRLLDSQNQKP